MVAADQQLPHGLRSGCATRLADSARKREPVTVAVYVFDRQGQFVGYGSIPLVELTDAEWKSRLTPEQYKVSRGKGTERAFCGRYSITTKRASTPASAVDCRCFRRIQVRLGHRLAQLFSADHAGQRGARKPCSAAVARGSRNPAPAAAAIWGTSLATDQSRRAIGFV